MGRGRDWITRNGRVCERKNNHHAFTLVELMVVIAIVSVVAAILLPVLAQSRQTAWRIACSNNLRSIGLQGFILYSHDHKGWALGRESYGGLGVPWAVPWSSLLGKGNAYSLNYIDWTRTPEPPAPVGQKQSWGVFRCPGEKNFVTGAEPINYGIYRHLSYPAFRGYPQIWAFDIQKYFNMDSVIRPSKLAVVSESRFDRYYLQATEGVGWIPTERHLSSANFVFVDGHVETISRDTLFSIQAAAPNLGEMEAYWPWGWK